jgi:hypothetical protein
MHRSCPCPAPRHLLPEAWQNRLVGLGWRQFVIDWHDGGAGPDHRVNFHRDSEPDWIWVAAMYAELTVRTMVEVFGVDSPQQVVPRFGPASTRRQASPAA